MPQKNHLDASEKLPDSSAEELREAETLRVVQILGPLADRWTFQIVREVFAGVRRYGQLQRKLGISRNILADRLSTLVEAEMLRKVRYRTEPDWYEYRVTQRLADLFPVIVMFYEWVFEYLEVEGLDRRVQLCECEGYERPLLVCSACAKPIEIDPDDVIL